MKDILNFLTQLSQNNNRDWFEANKSHYKSIQAQFNLFTEELINGISQFDTSIKGLKAKDCTYRIYRDVRFSHNKEPYKTHIGAYICPKGKTSGYAGYYLHLEPEGIDYIGGNILAAGLHCPLPTVLKSVREEIFANGEGFVSTLNNASDFVLDFSSTLKRTPKDFPQGSIYDEYLKLKQFDIITPITNDMLSTDKLLEYALMKFKTTSAFNQLLNRCVDYANQNMNK